MKINVQCVKTRFRWRLTTVFHFLDKPANRDCFRTYAILCIMCTVAYWIGFYFRQQTVPFKCHFICGQTRYFLKSTSLSQHMSADKQKTQQKKKTPHHSPKRCLSDGGRLDRLAVKEGMTELLFAPVNVKEKGQDMTGAGRREIQDLAKLLLETKQ